MYRMLVVDDVMYAVEGIVHGADWNSLNITEVLQAYDVDTAISILQEKQVDILICDIEMPERSGLELVQWVSEHSPRTESILLTAHADFAYAQKAIQLGSFDYMLKPAKQDQLVEIVSKALGRVMKSHEVDQFGEIYARFHDKWKNQLPILVDRFWQDILAQRTFLSEERLHSNLRMYEIPLTPQTKVTAVLISVEHWKEDLSMRDEEIMEYALRNVAAEIFLRQHKGHVVQDRNGINLVLLYGTEEEGGNPERIRQLCDEYMDMCGNLFHCSISCYVGDEYGIPKLAECYHSLLEMENKNVSGKPAVYLQADCRQTTPSSNYLPASVDWLSLLEAGKEQTVNKLKEYLEKLSERSSSPTLDILEACFFELISAVYTHLRKRGLSIHESIGAKDLSDSVTHTRSIHHLKSWASRIISIVFELTGSHAKGSIAVIEHIKQFIQKNLAQEISREEIAAHIHLNPAYLSRLFKKETGQSLSEYIIHERLTRAKKLLENSNLKIVHIAEEVGYFHFPHFTTMFKKVVGLTPQQYRKQFQNVGY